MLQNITRFGVYLNLFVLLSSANVHNVIVRCEIQTFLLVSIYNIRFVNWVRSAVKYNIDFIHLAGNDMFDCYVTGWLVYCKRLALTRKSVVTTKVNKKLTVL